MVEVSEEIKLALRNREGVVALESTIITHGMPYTENLETAIMVRRLFERTDRSSPLL